MRISDCYTTSLVNIYHKERPSNKNIRELHESAGYAIYYIHNYDCVMCLGERDRVLALLNFV